MGSRQRECKKKEIFREQEKKEEKVESESKNTSYQGKKELLGYESFFFEKDSKKMIVYEQYPKLEEILDYYFCRHWNAEHPIYEYGRFDIRELMEVIKISYSYHYNQDYQGIVMGYLEKTQFQVQEGIFEELRPHLCFLVGNDHTLEEYRKYQNQFLGSDQTFSFKSKANFVCLEARENIIHDDLGISCMGSNGGGITYYDYLKDQYTRVKYSDKVSIFDDAMFLKIRDYKGIQDTLSFPVHINDQFLAHILISIAIFKKNYQKEFLTNDDYRYIFYELFRDNSISIQKNIEKEVPKTLKYIWKK